MKSCNNCGLPETYETFEFDKIKFAMFAHSIKLKILKLIGVRKKKYLSLINEYRGKGDYDCIVPF